MPTATIHLLLNQWKRGIEDDTSENDWRQKDNEREREREKQIIINAKSMFQ